MAFRDQTDANFVVRRDYIRSGAAEPQTPPASLEPLRIAGILIVIGAIVAGGVWVFQSRPALPAAIQRALPESLNMSPASPVSTTTAAATAAVPPKAPAKPAAPPRRARAASPAVIAPLSVAPRTQVKPPQTSATASSAVVAAPPAPPVALARDAARPVPAGLYSSLDGDVLPPELVRPRSIGSLPSGMRPDDLVTFEFVVDERGTVVLAKVSSAPRTIGETMLFTMNLQSIKSWQFRPALKDGNPVRYRQLMSFGPKSTKTPPQG